MEILKINLENCYGIAKLNTEFDFRISSTMIIYAPNGCMKTSFAKTMNTISKGKKPEDEIFTDRISTCSVTDDNSDLRPEQILVFETYSDSYSSKDKMTSLLVNKDLKGRYTEILSSIEKEKDELIKNLKQISGSSNAENEILAIFKKKTILQSLDLVKDEVNSNVFWKVNCKYGEIVNPKVQEFLKSNSVLISDYLEKYDELVNGSAFFEKGVFGTENANVVTKSLIDNRFFEAQHKLVLKNETVIRNALELEQVIKSEKERIFTDDVLVKKFEKIDTAIAKNAELKTFKNILVSDPSILTLMTNYESFKKHLWINYLSSVRDIFNSLLEAYHSSQEEINNIIKQAIAEKTEWEEVVGLFNNRFDVPYKLKVLNQDDVILKEKSSPNIAFTYRDGRGELEIEENSIKLKAFSTGETRALYLLNVIFEIEARKKEGKECLLIFDDIADSFDYKNKYAIIEYLKDISESGLFKMIILTHNFDFYRTVASRLPILRKDCFMTIKREDEVKIVAGNYLKNVFESWVNEIEKNTSIYIASIPFARNLIEYIKGENDTNYLKLTNLLHLKTDTKTITINDLSAIYNTIWNDKSFTHSNRAVYELLFEEAERIIADTTETVQLESKIILSISIRLLTEEYMVSKISDKKSIIAIKSNQTTGLTKLYKTEFPQNDDEHKLIERVNLLTAENIHINAFMYEPILDLSDKHLKDLYTEIKSLMRF